VPTNRIGTISNLRKSWVNQIFELFLGVGQKSHLLCGIQLGIDCRLIPRLNNILDIIFANSSALLPKNLRRTWPLSFCQQLKSCRVPINCRDDWIYKIIEHHSYVRMGNGARKFFFSAANRIVSALVLRKITR
jgi:hypothetical protein